MTFFLQENWGNLLVLVLGLAALAMAAVIRSRWRSRKSGRSGCDGCPFRGVCHPEK